MFPRNVFITKSKGNKFLFQTASHTIQRLRHRQILHGTVQALVGNLFVRSCSKPQVTEIHVKYANDSY
jgi:hypothetical protein